MNKNSFLSLLVLAISIINYNSYGMDNDLSKIIIPLNKGLLTEVNGIISQTGFTTFGFCRHITGLSTKTDTLVNLIGYQKDLDNSKGAGPIELFCPVVYKVTESQYIDDLGQYDKDKHREAKEAIRQNKALYLAAGQGALIYALNHQPIPTGTLTLIKKLEAKINRKDKVTVQ